MTDTNINELDVGTTANDAAQVAAPATTTEAPDVKDPNTARRDAIAAAFDKYEQKPEAEEVAAKTALPQAAQQPATVTPAAPAANIDPVTGRTVEPIKAPAGWTPALREKWGNIDPQVQKFIVDRERDMAQTITRTSDERKLASEFTRIAEPYKDLLRQFNTTATEHTKELFELSYALNSSSAQQKAHIFYNLINHFKPDAGVLQALFAGQNVPHQPITPAPKPINVEAEVEKKLREREETQAASEVNSAIEAFGADPANEFFADVRERMGKIIEAGLVVADTYPELFKKAYDLAVAQDSEVQSVLAARSQTPATAAPAAPAQARPVGSVKPSLGAGKASKVPARAMSSREAAELAFDSLMAGR